MKTTLKKILLFLILFISVSNIVVAQNNKKDKHKLFKQALTEFDNEEFCKALPIFLKYDSLYPNEFEAKYYIGACYLNTPYQKTEGIPYLEFAAKNGEKFLPAAVFKDLARVYQLNKKFDEAIINYKKYLKLSFKDDEYRDYVIKSIADCEYAKKNIIDTLPIEINKINTLINNGNSNEYPFISTDDELMFFTRTFRKKQSVVKVDSVSKIYFSEKHNREWGKPKQLKINLPDTNLKTTMVGISPQGTELFFRIDIDSLNSDLFICKLDGDSCKELKAFNSKINTKFKESMCSITADGKDFYFSSNRPGGYGGFDIYRITKIDETQWATPVNLGNEINTIFDEDGPFIHPDKQTLYFSSKGHIGFGGYDFFVSEYQFFDNAWSEPNNLGYPINTTYNDIGIYLTADARLAYYSSSNNNKNQKYDIYVAKFSKSIPLTLVKGTITDENNTPILAHIKVVDHETQKQLKYIYNSNKKTGKYLMIFPPGKNYDMIVEADGYIPHIVNIYIPEQTYFYSLYQEIHLEKLRLDEFNTQIGEKITVTNTFYDIYNTDITQKNDSLKIKQVEKPDYSGLLEIIDKLITKTDSVGINQLDSITIYEKEKKKDAQRKNYDDLLDLVEEAFETTDSSSLDLLDKNTMYNDEYVKSYFFDVDNKEQGLQNIIVGDDTIKTFPPLKTYDINDDNNSIVAVVQQTSNPKVKINKQFDFTKSPISSRKYILNYSIYFGSNKSKVKSKYHDKLIEISKLLMNNSDLGVELNGYTDAKGKEKNNLILSNLRTRSVMQVLVENYVMPQRIILKGYGETKATKINNEKDRRVDINVFQLIDVDSLNLLDVSSEKEINKVYPINDTLINSVNKIIYKIQIASCSKYKNKNDEVFKGLSVNTYKYGKSINYTYGKFKTRIEAEKALQFVVKHGFNDAFIVKFIDNKRIN